LKTTPSDAHASATPPRRGIRENAERWAKFPSLEGCRQSRRGGFFSTCFTI